MQTVESRLRTVLGSKLHAPGDAADAAVKRHGDTAYYEACVTTAVTSVSQSLLAFSEWEPVGSVSRLDSAQATLLITVHDTWPLVEWPRRRLHKWTHTTVHDLTTRLRRRLKAADGNAVSVKSVDDPRVTASMRDVITWCKAVETVMGLHSALDKRKASQALRD